MEKLTLEVLTEACRAGGASILRCFTELAPAAGEGGGLAPARYVSGSKPTYAYETRLIDGVARTVVVLDGKASQLNRVEEQIAVAIEDGNEVLTKVPRIRVTYEKLGAFADYELPHRAFDGHIRAGSINGNPATASPAYVAVRNANPKNARALLETSACSFFGAWDSTRKANQARFRSPLVAEIIGELADQSPEAERNPRRGGSRVDTVAPSVQLSKESYLELLKPQEDELSSKFINAREKEAKGAKQGEKLSGSSLGLGSIPPSLDGLGLVACRKVIRHQTLSFAALRQLRFGADAEGNAACRALIAALILNGLIRSNSELVLRANCDLVEKSEPEFWLDGRYGAGTKLTPLDIDQVDALLEAAIEQARRLAGVSWEGQILEVIGSPIIDGSSEADIDEE